MEPRIVRHRYAQLDQFLSTPEQAWLMEKVLGAENDFKASGVSDGKDDYRHSLVLQPPPDVIQAMVPKLRSVLPDVIAHLRMQFMVGQIECQITANIDGSFFRVHTDAGHNDTIQRQLTYVYYFNRMPKAFTGGELRLYDDQVRNGKLARVDSFQTIEPRHNSIVFFHAAVMHEVTLVNVPSGDFRDSRFTVNGWIQRAF